ncbi:MAG: type II toxin-antitoxin system HipA family toxin [Sulfurovum sp.]|nr:type II toxin-antitoxin system HipA family toxin [Sulfurovum sp.]
MTKVVEIKLWGTAVGYLGYDGQSNVTVFEYEPQFALSAIQISPLKMPYPPYRHQFHEISFRSFKGVSGLFADSLPDKFGSQLIDQFMAQKHINMQDVTTLDRLLYIGNKGMGALEYYPLEFEENATTHKALDIAALFALAELVLNKKEMLQKNLEEAQNKEDALNLIRVGSSAGGARSKALVAMKDDGKLYDGTVLYDEPCTYWLLKFDSASNSDKEKQDPKGMTKIEYIYAQIARKCGIDMPQTHYIETGNDFHFMIERFDRINEKSKSSKLHYVSWAGLAHFDRDTTGAYAYEQLVLTARSLHLGQDAVTEIFRRAVFNIVGRNQDDHTKNFGFLMDKRGEWRLSPAFDLTYAFDPTGNWTKVHQLTLQGKQTDFSLDDLLSFGKYCNLSAKASKEIVQTTVAHFRSFDILAKDLEVSDTLRETVLEYLRVDF